jgi:hypothetical protein
MRKPVLRTDDEWRTTVIAELLGLRAALFELALLIAVIAVGASAARWWEGAPIAGAAIALISAIYCYRHALKERDALVNQHFAADAD